MIYAWFLVFQTLLGPTDFRFDGDDEKTRLDFAQANKICTFHFDLIRGREPNWTKENLQGARIRMVWILGECRIYEYEDSQIPKRFVNFYVKRKI